jgi:GxxExxY protein
MRSIDELSGMVVDAAIGVHRELGPGLFETVYEIVLAGRLEALGLKTARQVPVPLTIDGQFFEVAFKIDILVEDQLILEIKAVDIVEGACAPVVDLPALVEAARRAAFEFFGRDDEGGHSPDGERSSPGSRLRALCFLCASV